MFLQRKDAIFVPDSRERALLLSSGYGEKKLEFRADGTAGHVHEVLCDACADLAKTGYELCCSGQSSGGGRMMEVIEPPKKGFSVDFLRSWLNQAKCYVKPIQSDLRDKEGTLSSDSVRISYRSSCFYYYYLQGVGFSSLTLLLAYVNYG